MTTNVNDIGGRQWKKLRMAICLGWWGFVAVIAPSVVRLWGASGEMGQVGAELWRVRIVAVGAPLVLLVAGAVLTRLWLMPAGRKV